MKEIPLTKGLVALVSDEDYEWVSPFHWQAHSKGGPIYASRRESIPPRKHIEMHRFILQAPEGTHVDHINNNTLDNRRENLRLCSHNENMYNRRMLKSNKSGYRGVSKPSDSKKWVATISAGGNQYYLGCFDDPIEAAKVRDAKAQELHGEFARLNFPEGDGM